VRKQYIPWLFLTLAMLACVRLQPVDIVITATFQGATPLPEIVQSQAPAPVAPPQGTLINPTPNPTRPSGGIEAAGEYVVQAGDSLSGMSVSMHC